jgi:hypothetical protein
MEISDGQIMIRSQSGCGHNNMDLNFSENLCAAMPLCERGGGVIDNAPRPTGYLASIFARNNVS